MRVANRASEDGGGREGLFVLTELTALPKPSPVPKLVLFWCLPTGLWLAATKSAIA